MGNQNNIVKFGVPGFFGCSGVPGCSGVLWGALGCSGVFQSVSVFLCSCVPVFLCSCVPGFSTCHPFKSFCLRDRGRLGNGGQPISLKIGTQSRYVDLCNMCKVLASTTFFQPSSGYQPLRGPQRLIFSAILALFNLSFSNVQLTSVKNKTIFVMPYP